MHLTVNSSFLLTYSISSCEVSLLCICIFITPRLLGRLPRPGYLLQLTVLHRTGRTTRRSARSWQTSFHNRHISNLNHMKESCRWTTLWYDHQRGLVTLCGRLGVSELFYIKNEVLNFATTEDSGHKGRIPSAYNFEYVIYKWTYFPVWSLKFAINEPKKERVSDAKTIVRGSKPR
jgi:hypothetical protein